MVSLSPLMQLETDLKKRHPNIRTDATFPPKAFDALVDLIARAAARRIVDGEPEDVYNRWITSNPACPPR